MITINTWRDPYDAGFTPTKPTKVSFAPGLTVLVGCNGAGKSTLLLNIKEQAKEQNLPCHMYDNLNDGGNHLGEILGGYGEKGDDIGLGISLFTASEGEEIKGNIGRQSLLYKEFLKTGHYKNRSYRMSRIFSEDKDDTVNTNIRILLFDAVDSGLSVDAIVEVKALFDILLQDAAKMELELYLIIAANEYELARESQCFDVNSGKPIKFANYEEYREFIINNRKIKEIRINKSIKWRENRRQKEITRLKKQYEKKLAKYQKIVADEASGKKAGGWKKYDAANAVKAVIRELKDYGVEMPEFKVDEEEKL